MKAGIRSLWGLGVLLCAAAGQQSSPGWTHLSVRKGDLPAPNPGTQQTAAVVFDVNRDGINDFVIAERTAAPAVVWYRRSGAGWSRYVIEADKLRVEAGAIGGDVDGDGDPDLIAAGDASSNEVWWWENPYPAYEPGTPWRRYLIKASGAPKHHDVMWGDFDGDGRAEAVFWNQGASQLVLARVPPNPKQASQWSLVTIYRYSADGEPLQRALAPKWKRINEHEGLCSADVDGDGKPDIVGGGRWFKHLGGDRFEVNIIDAGYSFSRCATGQLIEGGRPEVVLVAGDGTGPLLLYQWVTGVWTPQTILERMQDGHSLAVADFDGDGHADIFCAEMRLDGGNPDAKTWLLLGDGRGSFRTTLVARGFDNHESKLADLDGDGRLDVLGKPYNHQTPDLNIWLNTGRR